MLRNGQNAQDGQIALSTFDAPHVGAVEFADVGELLLRPAALRAKLANPFPKSFLNCGVFLFGRPFPLHQYQLGIMLILRLQTIAGQTNGSRWVWVYQHRSVILCVVLGRFKIRRCSSRRICDCSVFRSDHLLVAAFGGVSPCRIHF
jgi:hypothetical protein